MVDDDEAFKRRVRERLSKIDEELSAPEATAEPEKPEATAEPEEPEATAEPEKAATPRGRARAASLTAAFFVGPLLLLQIIATLATHSGNRYEDAEVHGDATVVSCERRGPVGVFYLGYWDECTADVRLGRSYAYRKTFDRPNLFHAGDVGTTVRIGRMRTEKYSHNRYAREGFPPNRAVDVLVWILILIDLIPLCLLAWVSVTAVKATVSRLFGLLKPRRRSA